MSPNPNTRHGPLRLEPGNIHAFAVSWEVDLASAFTNKTLPGGLDPHPLRMSVKNVRLMPPAAMPVKRLQPAFFTAILVKG
jgi:hypothetical protein